MPGHWFRIGSRTVSAIRNWLEQLLAPAETAKLLHPSGAVLLFYTWVAYQGFPLFPVLSRTRLDDKFRYLFAAVSISPLETFSYFVEWLVVASLVKGVVSTERIRSCFPFYC